MVLPAWATVSVVVPLPPLKSLITPPAPPREGTLALREFRSSVPALTVRPPLPRARALPNCSVPALTTVPAE